MISAQLPRLGRLVTIAALASWVLLFPSTTLAAEDAEAAKAHYATGLQHFNLAEFEQALAEFKEAYRNKPDPAFLFNIGQCHRKLGHMDEAITFYQSYLREAPDAKNRKEVERRIEELRSLSDAENASIATSIATKARPSPASQAAQENAIAQTTATTIPAAGVGLDARNESPVQPSSPIYRRWWFWTAAGTLVVGAATVAIMMTRRDPTSIPGSTLGAQRAMP